MDLSNMRSFRPYMHFTSEKNWLNAPNGLVYANGKYHLFYQYCMADKFSMPLHWGHAASTDLVHWNHLPIALKPDELGCIFSGEIFVDGGSRCLASAVYPDIPYNKLTVEGEAAVFLYNGKSDIERA